MRITVRFDDENYQIGYEDICDRPCAETIAGSRDLGRMLYQLRSTPR